MKKHILTIISLFAIAAAHAQNVWSVDRCMAFAIKHSHEVKQKTLALDNQRANHTEAIGSFLPKIEGSVGMQYNFGRAIDPETNAYTNVNTFYNSYGLSASLPVFDGMARINRLKMAKANRLMGKYGLQASQDDVAMRVFQAFIDVLYYRGTLRMANEKRHESELMLRQTEVMVEVGQKSEADRALMDATLATDEYEVTRQENLLATAEITLKQLMNYPLADALQLDTTIVNTTTLTTETPQQVLSSATLINPTLREAAANVKSARYSLKSAWAAVMPSLYVGAGYSTTFYKTLGQPMGTSFRDQLKNNAGEYVYASLSIPIFNGLSTASSIRRQRNNLRMAQDLQEQKNAELEKLIYQAVADKEGYIKEVEKMKRKVKSDSLAAHVTLRKYQEGQSSAIDVQTSAVSLLQSKASLLQCQLTLILKEKMINYYKGEPLVISE